MAGICAPALWQNSQKPWRPNYLSAVYEISQSLDQHNSRTAQAVRIQRMILEQPAGVRGSLWLASSFLRCLLVNPCHSLVAAVIHLACTPQHSTASADCQYLMHTDAQRTWRQRQ